MNERQLTNKWRKSMSNQGLHIVDIPDGMDMVGRPYDVAANVYGRYVGIEFKRTVGYKSLSYREIRESQVRGLNSCERGGGIALMGIFVWESRKINRLYWFEWSKFKRMTNGLQDSLSVKYLRAKEDFDDWDKGEYGKDAFQREVLLALTKKEGLSPTGIDSSQLKIHRI